jgi:hypothetical protein
MDRRDRINNRRLSTSYPVHPVDPCSSVPQEHHRYMTKPWEIRGHFLLVAASPRWVITRPVQGESGQHRVERYR